MKRLLDYLLVEAGAPMHLVIDYVQISIVYLLLSLCVMCISGMLGYLVKEKMQWHMEWSKIMKLFDRSLRF